MKIAAIITEWRKNSHADVILSRICDPAAWGHKHPFDMELVSMYVEHFPEHDFARDKAKKHEIAMKKDIKSAIANGGRKIAVDGVLVIGEHGPYFRNLKGQQFYPRRRFLDEVAESFRKLGGVVPVFTDKHFSYEPLFTQWVIQTYKHMGIPLMAGSSLPVAWRLPEQTWPINTSIKRAFAQGYSDLDAYGFHTLETLQCQVERRTGGETGVKSVRSLASGESAWKHPEFPKDLWQAFEKQYHSRPQHSRNPNGKSADELWEIRYTDGLIAHVGMFTSEGQVWGTSIESGTGEIQSTVFELEDKENFGHFGYLTKGIEHLIKTGRSPYPAERTEITTGILAALLQSKSEGGTEIPTPFLSSLAYQAAEWPFATGIIGTPA